MASCDIEPVYVDGILEVNNLGPNVEMVFFRYQRAPSGLIKMATLPVIRPRLSFLDPNSVTLRWADQQLAPDRPMLLHS